MRQDIFDKISSSNKEEIWDTGIGLTTATNQPLSTIWTFLIKMDIQDLGRITHPVIVVEQLVWPLLLGFDTMALHRAKVEAGHSTVTLDLEGDRRRVEVVLSKQEHLPAYSMRIVKAQISQKRKAGTALTLDSGHLNIVSGLYYVGRQGIMYNCLVDETADEVVIRDELLGEHILVNPEDMVTLVPPSAQETLFSC